MKKLLEYQIYDKNIYSVHSFYQPPRLKYNLQSSTPTLMGISLKHLKTSISKFYANENLYSLYCRNCDNFFLVPFLNQMYKKEPITCPTCGNIHTYNHYRIREENNIDIPYNIHLTLYELKESIKLKLKYNAANINNIFKDFNEKKISEEFTFNIKDNSVVWTKQKEPLKCSSKEIHTETYQIGYLQDFDFMRNKTALSYIFFKDSDTKNQKISVLFSTLRKTINKKMKQKGLSERKMYYNQGNEQKAFMNILTIANRFRFWNGFPFNIEEKQNVSEWLILHHLNPIYKDFDKKIEDKMKENKTYIQAFTETFDIPNTKVIRKNLTFENLHIIKAIYKTIPHKIVAGNYVEPVLEYHKEESENKRRNDYHIEDPAIYKNFLDLYETFASYYKLTPTMIKNELKKHSRDTIHLWEQLDKKSMETFLKKPPAFSKLHDELSILLAKQKDRDVVFNIPEDVINRMNLYLQNSKSTVLEKYSQIKTASLQMKNCAASYKNRIDKNLQLVLISDDKGKPQVLLEINNNSIVQAKLFNNIPVRNNQILNNTVLEFAEKTNLQIKTIDIKITKPTDEIKLSA